MNVRLHRAAVAALIALIGLGVLWELWLAPLRAGDSWLVLKVLPLMAVLPGVLRARNYVMQWSVLLIWIYVTEGLVRASSETGATALLAGIELALALAYFTCTVALLRPLKQRARQQRLKGDSA